MAQQHHKERERPRGTTAVSPPKSNADRVAPKDPDLYDPVGMAGEQAGIVKEIEDELKGHPKEEGRDEQPEKREGEKPGK
jgi:hypothetical protein